MQAIVTKYLGPTNYRGARIKATCNAKSITVSRDRGLNISANHAAAARELALQLGWLTDGWELRSGSLPGMGDQDCHVLVNPAHEAEVAACRFSDAVSGKTAKGAAK
jgi:hypothetical protein